MSPERSFQKRRLAELSDANEDAKYVEIAVRGVCQLGRQSNGTLTLQDIEMTSYLHNLRAKRTRTRQDTDFMDA